MLSGGSTLFRSFDKRLEKEITCLVDRRLQLYQARSATAPSPVPVKVKTHKQQRHAVWFGGSLFACADNFATACHTKAEYEEVGAAVARYNPVQGAFGL